MYIDIAMIVVLVWLFGGALYRESSLQNSFQASAQR
jgi:hypothetical protein